MLLNISNHPSTEWHETQLRAARELFGSVTDLTHPEIDPEAESDAVLQIVEEFYLKVRETDPAAVHLMGEHTFCHALIPKLQKAGYPVWCSTTRRTVRKVSETEVRRTFEFVRFRRYVG